MQLSGCRDCALLHVRFRLLEFLVAEVAGEPWLVMAAEARKAASLVREACNKLLAAWRLFRPTALREHQRWKQYPQLRKLLPQRLKVAWLAVPLAMRCLDRALVGLDEASRVNEMLGELQFRQPADGKPVLQLLWEVESALHDGGVRDRETAEIVCEGAPSGRIGRLRSRRKNARRAARQAKCSPPYGWVLFAC